MRLFRRKQEKQPEVSLPTLQRIPGPTHTFWRPAKSAYLYSLGCLESMSLLKKSSPDRLLVPK
jgi:hypothetical protein